MTAPIAIIMGSQSDWDTMRHAAATLEALGVAAETRIVSAHRTPDRINAALLAAAVLALSDPALSDRLAAWRKAQTEAVAERPEDKA